ncbi:alpha/beta hydrolase [Mycolicibacterium sp. P1-18]|uniref:alpha/beta fold hydrolase n=1 Tax=Mycolicibacterium sp. P1-18 TaxID=2024615 RepID=UPI0011F27AAB|nr:alpha/beta hydrolase [Mycolicibacterium sp. P1-18]KAA0101094.1 alpha/beta hydrolase [Mycolicibacterium sp. P1-18]
MKSVEVTAGTVEYREDGDPAGPPVVLLHGLLMNDSQWELVLPLLPTGHRYLLPVLPMGGHRVPMRADADLTMPGMVGLVADFLDALGLTDVVLVVTDWGGPLFLTDMGRDDRVGRMIVCPSEAFENFPPGLPGKVTWLATRTPLTVSIAMRMLAVGWLRRQYLVFGMMAKKPVPQPIVAHWFEHALRSVALRRDLIAYARSRFETSELVRATESLARFDGDVLVLWSRNPVMPDRHAHRLAELTNATLRYVDDAHVLIMLDQPEQTARAMSAFLASG